MTAPLTPLAPCPFCGGAAEASVYAEGQDRSALIICNECMATSSVYDTETEAVGAWNRRALNDQTEALAQWMHERGIATGHGDTVADLLRELAREWHRRAPALRWRREPPDVPGWWWCEYRRGTPAISHYTQEQCSKRRAWPSTPDTRWAGPIAEPEGGGE